MPTTLSRKVLALVAAGASAAAIATQFLQEKEGPDALVAYQDDNAVWTACMGVTKGVHAGSRFTPQQCEQMDKEAVSEAAAEVDRIVKVPMSEPERAAVISFCAYNIGPGKCSQSTFLKDLNAGNRAAACAQINRWIFDGGRDCRIRSNGCAGQVVRRQQETELCRMN